MDRPERPQARLARYGRRGPQPVTQVHWDTQAHVSLPISVRKISSDFDPVLHASA
jgi:hypothetical protein